MSSPRNQPETPHTAHERPISARLTDSWVPPDPRHSPQRASKPPEDVPVAQKRRSCALARGTGVVSCNSAATPDRSILEILFHRLHPADQPPSPDRGLAGRAPSAETSPNQPSACQSGAVNRSLTVVVAVPSFAVRVVVTRSRSAPPCAPSSIRAHIVKWIKQYGDTQGHLELEETTGKHGGKRENAHEEKHKRKHETEKGNAQVSEREHEGNITGKEKQDRGDIPPLGGGCPHPKIPMKRRTFQSHGKPPQNTPLWVNAHAAPVVARGTPPRRAASWCPQNLS